MSRRMDQPFAANCIQVTGEGPLEGTRMRWRGACSRRRACRRPGAALGRAAAVAALAVDGADAPAIEAFTPTLDDADLLVQVAEHMSTETSGVSLAEAKVIVSGGRGVGSAEGFRILEELAGLLGGAVGCSRVVTSSGWRPHTDQVGQTGTKVSPDLYIACGISGATQHIAGCKGKKILAINSDAEAPITASADYAVIGDLTEIVPAVTAELKEGRRPIDVVIGAIALTTALAVVAFCSAAAPSSSPTSSASASPPNASTIFRDGPATRR